MKKIISLILVLLLLVGLTACSKTGGSGGQTPEPAEPKVEKIEMQLEHDKEAQITGYIKAFADDGSIVWEYTTNRCPVGQNDLIQEIGLSSAGYMFLEMGSVYCLDPATGEVLWVNEDFGGDGASWDFDDTGNLYLTGYFEPWLFCVGPDGKTLADYRAIPEEYEDYFYWPASLSLDSDGMVHIHYFSNDLILIVEPFEGEVIDTYWYTEALDEEFLTGEWLDDKYNPTVRLIVYDNLDFEFFLNVDSKTSYYYEGRFDLDILSEEYSPGPDWLRTELIYTDDPVIDEIGSVGDFIVTYSSRDGEDDYIYLVQVNNGDSFLSVNLDEFGVVLFRVSESAGPVG